MKYTGNYNLKKPEGSDIVNIEDFNDNADIIDQALKAHDDALATKETPQGAQEKADAALNSAKQYTDQEVGEVAQALTTHLAETLTEIVNLKTAFGAVGDGITDDTVAVQSFFEHLASTGGIGYAPKGTYLLTSPILVMPGNGFTFTGAGMGRTVFKRGNFEGWVMSFQDIDGMTMSDFTIDGNSSVPGGTVGFNIQRTSNSYFSRIEAKNCGTAGMFFISGTDEIEMENVHVSECIADNVGASGIQLQGAKNSGISRCYAKDCLGDLGTGSGIYFKVPIENCYHSDNTAVNCNGPAFAVGSSFPGKKGKYLTFSNGRSINCGFGILFGEVEDSIVTNMSLGLTGGNANGTGDGVRLESGAIRNRFTNIAVQKVGNSRAAARLVGTAAFNTIKLSSFTEPATGALIAAFQEETEGNYVIIQRGYTPPSGVEVLEGGTDNIYKVETT